MLVVLDIECFNTSIIKELGVYYNGTSYGYSFQPPKGEKPDKQSQWLTRNFHLIDWNSGDKPYTELKDVLTSLLGSDCERISNLEPLDIHILPG